MVQGTWDPLRSATGHAGMEQRRVDKTRQTMTKYANQTALTENRHQPLKKQLTINIKLRPTQQQRPRRNMVLNQSSVGFNLIPALRDIDARM